MRTLKQKNDGKWPNQVIASGEEEENGGDGG